MKFLESNKDDLPQITRWIAADLYHDVMQPDFWLTGNDCIFACRVEDETGPILYLRVDKEGELARIHTQFAPENEVSRVRVAKSMIRALPKTIEFIRDFGCHGVVFVSISPTLVKAMRHFGFVNSEKENDYILMFE